jgi:hypothetical protein
MNFLSAIKKGFQPTRFPAKYQPLRTVENIKWYENHNHGLHPSEIERSYTSPRAVRFQFPDSTQLKSRPVSIAYNAELQDLYDATMDFLSDGEEAECAHLPYELRPFELPDDEALDEWVADSAPREGATWPTSFEVSTECTSVEVLFDFDLEVDADSDGVQETTALALAHVEESAPGTLSSCACLGNVTVQDTGYTPLEALKEPEEGSPHLGAYFDGQSQQMVKYMALDHVCSLDDEEESSVASEETVSSTFSQQFFEFPGPAFSQGYSDAALKQDATAEESGTEQLEEHHMKVRISVASSGDVCRDTSMSEPLEVQLQAEYDGKCDKFAYALDYELEHDAARLKCRNRAASLRPVDLATIEKGDEPCSTGSSSFVSTLLGCFVAPYDDAESDSSSGTESSVTNSPTVAEDSLLPGQMLPSPQLLNQVSTEIDGLLTHMYEQLDEGCWGGLPALGCNIHLALRALGAEYPVLGIVERLGAAVETLVESVAALESVHTDLLEDGGSA